MIQSSKENRVQGDSGGHRQTRLVLYWKPGTVCHLAWWGRDYRVLWARTKQHQETHDCGMILSIINIIHASKLRFSSGTYLISGNGDYKSSSTTKVQEEGKSQQLTLDIVSAYHPPLVGQPHTSSTFLDPQTKHKSFIVWLIGCC